MLRIRLRLGLGRWVTMLGMALAVAAPAAAQGVLLTLVDGDAVVIDGARRGAAAPGLRIAPATIVETGAKTTLLRLEWPDKSVIDLGPSTRVMVLPPGFKPRSGRPAAIYLLQGWIKVAGNGTSPAGGVLAPALEVLPFSGAAVVFANKRDGYVFAESGPVEVADRASGGAQRGLPPGGLWSADGTVAARPPADWPPKVPRAFRDTIPMRAALFKDRVVNASALPPPTYVDLADWLAAEPSLRRDFPRRFAALAQDAAFRRALQGRLSAHPEWAPVLNPPQR